MNKTELIDLVGEKAGLPKAAAARAVDATLAAVTASLQKGDPVVLVNFGTWTVKERAAREAYSPITREKIKISAVKVVRFKAGKALKEVVKDKEEVKEELREAEVA